MESFVRLCDEAFFSLSQIVTINVEQCAQCSRFVISSDEIVDDHLNVTNNAICFRFLYLISSVSFSTNLPIARHPKIAEFLLLLLFIRIQYRFY